MASMMDSARTSSQRRGPMLRKSMSGCRDCKLRKVKCDEVRPVCSNCRRRYINIQCCDWNIDTSRKGVRNIGKAKPQKLSGDVAVRDVSANATDAYISSLNLQPSSYPQSPSSTSQWRTMELRLMYHYTAVVSHTMPGCSGAPKEAWQRTIPQLSFESEVVLSPMLALSALHLHAHSGNDHNMAVALRRYLHQSLVNHRKALSNSGEELSEHLWLSAVLLSHIYWLLAHQVQPNEAYDLPLQAFNLLEGVGDLFERKSLFLARQGYEFIGNEALQSIAPEIKLSEAAQIQLQDIDDDLTYLLDTFDVSSMSNDDKSIYLEAKHYVLHHYRAFFSGADPRTFQRFVGFMAAKCQPGYRKKLKQYDPLAMALMARMLVLLSVGEHAWWLVGKGDYEVIERDVQGICELLPKKLRWVMDWPCKVLNGEIVLTRDIRSLVKVKN